MLGKLFGYEMRATARVFLPTYLVLLAFAVLSRISLSVYEMQPGNGRLATELMAVLVGFYVAVAAGAFVVALVVIIRRFYKNLTGDEGYLMFTLPVETWQLVTAKLLSAVMWQMATLAAVAASVAILLFRLEFLPDVLAGIRTFWEAIRYELGLTLTAAVVLSLVLAFLSTIQGILLIYAAIAIGHTIRGHRILGSVGAYIGLSVAWQMVSSVVTMLTTGGMLTTGSMLLEAFWVVPLIGIFLSLAACGLLFFITVYILGRQLNLE